MTEMDERLAELRQRLDDEEVTSLSPRATLSREAVRRRPDPTATQDHRQQFAIDTDRILHSLAYTRYIDKTQVFYLIKDDHVSHRVLHVQLVSRIARTIGRHLGLNADLIEAVALGHDLGHPPFGHDGEALLSRLCQAHGIGHFVHEAASVHFLERVERKGRGLNLSLQVLDGILTHNGEADMSSLSRAPARSFPEFDRLFAEKVLSPELDLLPMTFEGCVVRLADTISYVGRDIEDAIRLNLIQRSELPRTSTRLLGETNGQIVYRLVSDLIHNSYESSAVGFSPEVAEALGALKDFNREHIYYNPRVKTQGPKIERLFDLLFEGLLQDLQNGREDSPICSEFLKNMAPEYLAGHSPPQIVRDFIAGMTDEYFLRLGRELLLPTWLEHRFD
jgi:dGTPase